MTGFIKIKNRLLILVILAFVLVLLLLGLLFLFSDSWLGGNNCLYDDGSGFIEMEDGESLVIDDDSKVSCQGGKLVFD